MFLRPLPTLALALIFCAASSLGESLHVHLADPSLLQSRLQAGIVSAQQRQSAIATMFTASGCQVREQKVDKKSSNVVCTLPGDSPATIVVGAHFDFADEGEGIVDDWSGTALLPSLFDALKTEHRVHTFEFAAFTGEERGLVGSARFVKELSPEERAALQAFVNLKCLGLTPPKVWVRRSTPLLVQLLASVATAINVPLQGVNVDKVGDDDTHPFLDKKLPVICIHSVTQETWGILHSPRDNVNAINRDDYYNAYKPRRFLPGLLRFQIAEMNPFDFQHLELKLQRRTFLHLAASAALSSASSLSPQTKPDFTLRIGDISWDVAPGKTVKTTGFNGAAPGPLIRVREGQQVSIEVVNDLDRPDIVHWHGLHIPSDVDGAMEEGTPMVAAHSSRLYSFTATPSGSRWYHTHTMAGRNVDRATYSGEFGFFYIDPKSEPGAYDQEHFLAFHEWDAYLTTGSEGDDSINVAYKHCSVNAHALGFGDPIRVKPNQRVMLRLLNASATVHRRIAFAGHRFQVIAMDGNPLPAPKETDILEMGPAERIDAIVEMNQPGVWILGATDDHDRRQGSGIIVEYAGQSGEPVWTTPPATVWDYRNFGQPNALATTECTSVPLVFQKKWAGNRWVDHWTINGKSYPKTDKISLRANQNYRLIFDNRSDEAHPVHLHRHTFELALVNGTPTSGVFKDVVVVGPKRTMEVVFKANNPGSTLFHCHQQMHMDYGFMTLMDYA